MHAYLNATGRGSVRSSRQGLCEVGVADESDREQVATVEGEVQERWEVAKELGR